MASAEEAAAIAEPRATGLSPRWRLGLALALLAAALVAPHLVYPVLLMQGL